MRSAEATVDGTVVVPTSVRGKDATRAAMLLAVIAITQLAWLGGIVYAAIWLLT